MNEDRNLPLVLGGIVAIAAIVVVAVVAIRSGSPPSGPVEVAWDEAACAECAMHVGEPSFAAQLHTAEGDVHMFDDPGCLFLFEQSLDAEVHSRWFHHYRDDRWIEGENVGFVATEPTPMGFGWGAVDAGTADSIGLAAARQQVVGDGEER